jgi:translation initiation factor IF-3
VPHQASPDFWHDTDPAKRRQHHRLPPAPIAQHHRSSGPGPSDTTVDRQACTPGPPRGATCDDWLPLGSSGSHCSFPGRRHGRDVQGLPSTRNTGGPISTELRINERIRVPEVRLVGPNGETVGIVPTDQALKLAQEADLDLVEIAPQGRPPVCKLMDYGKFKYENAQKAREARRNQTNVIIKEMKLRPKIDQHDYETKKGHVVRFLGAGDKVKITIMFRGREQHRPELGFRLLQRLAEDVQELGFVESAPKQDGRNMIMVLGPHKKKAEAKAEVKAEKVEAAAEKAAEQAEIEAEIKASQTGPAAQKKERKRSENLDPEIEA